VQLGLYAYFLYGFGPVLSFLRDEQGTSNTMASLHSSAMALGAMAGGALFPWLSRRFGRSTVMWGSLALVAVSVLALVTLPPLYWLTLTLIGLIAIGGMCVVSTVVVTLSQMHGAAGSSAISEANALAVFAGLIAPLAIGLAVSLGLGWRAGVSVLIGLAIIVAFVAWRKRLVLPPAVSVSEGQRVKRPLPAAYWLTWTILVFTGCIEIVLSLWTAIVLREEINFTPAAASAAVSAILLGMFLGRSAGARLALHFKAIPLFLGALVISLIGFTVFWTAGSGIIAVTGLLIAGLGNAMHYPLVIALALAVAPDQADRAAGVTSYSMGLSFGAGPFLLGILADSVTAHKALLLVPVFIVIAALLAWRLAVLTSAGAAVPRAGGVLASADAAAPEVSNRAAEVVEQVA
jgi:predicted MFS family arabinose efflux permease